MLVPVWLSLLHQAHSQSVSQSLYTSLISSLSPSEIVKLKQLAPTLFAPEVALPLHLSKRFMRSTGMSYMTVWEPKPELRHSDKFFGLRPSTPSVYVAFLPSFRLLSSVACRLVAQSLTCGSAVHAHASCSISDSMQRTKARCMLMSMSKLPFSRMLFIVHGFYRISVSIVVAFVARGLSNIPGDLFCYSAVSSAGVVVILPGFTI